MGTGTFVDVNTGKEPHASVAGKFKSALYCFTFLLVTVKKNFKLNVPDWKLLT